MKIFPVSSPLKIFIAVTQYMPGNQTWKFCKCQPWRPRRNPCMHESEGYPGRIFPTSKPLQQHPSLPLHHQREPQPVRFHLRLFFRCQDWQSPPQNRENACPTPFHKLVQRVACCFKEHLYSVQLAVDITKNEEGFREMERDHWIIVSCPHVDHLGCFGL